jgi:RNA polymerase sigma factor (sigma-70 family)
MAHRRPLTPEQAKLAAAHYGYAVVVGGRFAAQHGLDRDEVRSYLHEILYRAAHDYDPARCGEPVKFFGFQIRNRLIDYLRHERRREQFRPAVSLGDYDPAAPESPAALDDEGREAIRAAMDRLDGRERRVLRERYGFDGPPRSDRQIGPRMGISNWTAGQIGRRALASLREMIDHP